jgi:hypothetical protein
MDGLKRILSAMEPGAIAETAEVERLLAGCWDDLGGVDEGGMQGYKLLNRMEDVVWRPPVLSFVIERHGGTVMGSTRAELQHWSVDVDERTTARSGWSWRTSSRIITSER